MAFVPSYVGFFEDGTTCYPSQSYSEVENSWILVAAAVNGLKVSGGYFARAQEKHKELCNYSPKDADVIVYSKSSLPNLDDKKCLELDRVYLCKTRFDSDRI